MHIFSTRQAAVDRLGGALLALVATVALSGCLDIERRIVLDQDLSGTASVRITRDLEPMLYTVTSIVRHLSGDTGEPTAKELRATAQLMARMLGREGDLDSEAFRRAHERSLPDGVTLTEVRFSRDELKLQYEVAFAFDHFEKLGTIELADTWKDKFPSAGRLNQIVHTPFAFPLADQGETFLVTSEPINPDFSPAKFSRGFAHELKGLRLYLRMDAPFEVVEHNTTLVQGTALIWEYGYETLTAGSAPAQIRVRYRK